MRRNRLILTLAQYISMIFTPFYLPVMGLVALFSLTCFNIYHWAYKLQLVFLVWIFTCLMPTTLIRLYRKYQGWSLLKLLSREGRVIPYLISIACYFTCYYLMILRNVAHLMASIVVAALVIQIICAMVNHRWKLSTHTAAVGGTAGAVMAFSLLFNFNPLWWLCVLIILAGIIGTGRMILRIHTLSEIVGGYLIGVLSGFMAVVLC